MPNSTPSSSSPLSNRARPNSGGLRATNAGTEHFRDRFSTQFAADYFRPSTFGPTVSSIGIGTYLGDSAADDDQAYEAAIRRAIESGINLIDTAINYRSQ